MKCVALHFQVMTVYWHLQETKGCSMSSALFIITVDAMGVRNAISDNGRL